jgi:predicted peptidase
MTTVQQVKAVHMICGVCPEGQKLTAASVEYECEVAGSSLTNESFAVADRVVTNVYASTTADGSKAADCGRFVIVELSREDAAAELAGYDQPGPKGVFIRPAAKLTLRQTKALQAVDGSVLAPWQEALEGQDEIEPLVEKFTQHVFHSNRTGQDLPYNLFLPENYDENGSYPLLMYIHDRGPLDTNVKTTLRQGIGAVVWVTPEEQAKHPCIVIAPQYAKVPSRDGDPDMLETTFDLYEDIIQRYAVDTDRLYTTGQSMGCMSSIEMGIRRPDFFTAFLLVAGQWDADAMTALNQAKMFIIVSRGDPRAFPGMNASLEKLAACGAEIQYAAWDQDGGVVPPEQVEELRSRPANIHYAVLKTEKRDVSCHMDTWKVAYGIEGARDWLFQQTKKG